MRIPATEQCVRVDAVHLRFQPQPQHQEEEEEEEEERDGEKGTEDARNWVKEASLRSTAGPLQSSSCPHNPYPFAAAPLFPW